MAKIKKQQIEAYLLGGGFVSFLREYFRISKRMAERLEFETSTVDFAERRAKYQVEHPRIKEKTETWELAVAAREKAYKKIEKTTKNDYGWDFHTRTIIKKGSGAFKTWKKIFTDLGYAPLVDRLEQDISRAISVAKYEDFADVLAESHFYRIKEAQKNNDLDRCHIKTLLVFLVKITPVFPTKIKPKTDKKALK